MLQDALATVLRVPAALTVAGRTDAGVHATGQVAHLDVADPVWAEHAPRLLRRLATDRGVPRGVRIRLALLMAYLAIPIDLIPDFIPVLGYADDAIVVTLVLRGTVRRAGLAAVRAHWPGTEDGFAALCRLTGLAQPAAGTGPAP